jgi:hypothetical protein
MQRTRNPAKISPRLPHPALPEADWADCYQLRVDDRMMTAGDAARAMLGHFPAWVRVLMALRNALVAPLGIKPSTAHSPGDMEMIGIFPVVSRSPSEIVLGFDDRHLDFRAVITVEDDGDGRLVSATTLVKRKILIGRLYLVAITPFHNLVVRSALGRLKPGLSPLNPRP